VSECLGWASYAYLAGAHTEQGPTLAKLTEFILSEYTLNVTALSDVQAPATAVTLAAMMRLDRLDLGEQIASLLFNSISSHGGNLARTDIDDDRIIDYLLARSRGDYSQCNGLLEQPIELLTILIICAESLGLEDVFNDDLWTLDHVVLAAYITSDFTEYGDGRMEKGDYRTWQIGADVFRCSDLKRNWGAQAATSDLLARNGAIIGSLLHGDRTPWFLIMGAG